ncbi:MAG: M20/M25/M40 family metallo-hydrolase [Dehalococcoidia bacterium]|nr:M20/M25/M40 family metallo-hydrolase [Dehalococcoidia bacterium]
MLAPLFESAGVQTVPIDIPATSADGRDGRMVLVGHRRRLGRERLLVYSHIDVVPAQGWRAFEPRRSGGLIFGRGAADMKGAIASLLGALESVRDVPLEYDLSVLVTMDEETQQRSQLEYVTSALDPGTAPHVLSLDAGFGYVSIANLGVLQMDVMVRGESVHSGLSHLGKNAVEDANVLIGALLSLKERVVQRRSSIKTHPDTGLSFMEPRLNVNRVEGGLARNIVPDSCVFSIDRRLLPDERIEDARSEIMETLGGVSAVNWEILRESVIEPVPPCNDPEASVLADTICSVTGESGLYGEMISGDLPGAATRLWRGSVFGAGLIRPESRIHGIDEFVSERDMNQLTEVLGRFLTRNQKEAA